MLIRRIYKIPIYTIALSIVIVMRLIRYWIVVRIGVIRSSRIGHLVANVEMYLCEQDAGINIPSKRYVDLFYTEDFISNKQIIKMWEKKLHIWPSWIMKYIHRINFIIPGGRLHEIGQNTLDDRDVHNLLDRFKPHLEFTTEEESLGIENLQAMGIPNGSKFVCLIVRDSAYLSGPRWDHHNYRDSQIQNYVLSAEELSNRGYFVIRMGAKVHEAINCTSPKVIDYATNGMRSEFMDIYLGAKCSFCISTGTGWDAVPECFRRPIVFVNFMPLEGMHTWRSEFIAITKKHFWRKSQKEMTLKEIFETGAASCYLNEKYDAMGIHLSENTPEEIRDVVIEMVERLEGSWRPHQVDNVLQQRFWDIFISKGTQVNGIERHGQIRSRIGAEFLRSNLNFFHS